VNADGWLERRGDDVVFVMEMVHIFKLLFSKKKPSDLLKATRLFALR
jgi:hypothetical protein